MSKYEAYMELRHNEDKIVISVASAAKEGWPEKIVEKLLEVLKGQLEDFVVTEKKVKS